MLLGFLIGILFGFLLQRGQFCFVSGFRSLFLQKNSRFLTALFIAISIQSVGFFALSEFGLITIPTGQMPVIATLAGGFLFGFGMVLTNCCGSGAWFRTGEGAGGSWIALVCFALTLAATQSGALKWWINPLLSQPQGASNIYLSLGVSPWLLVGVLLVITAGLLYYQATHPRYSPPQAATNALIPHRLFTRHWHPFVTAVLIGLLGIVAWLSSAYEGREYGFGIAVPSANLIQYIVIGQQRYLNWGSGFVLGILIGAFISAKLSGEFALRSPDPKTLPQRILGGIIMGIGAALAGGCTVTNSLVATAYFSWQGWLATLMTMLGCRLAFIFIKPTQCRL